MAKSFVIETPDELTYIAESDLIAAKELFSGTYYPDDRMYNIICFHATQAVEKFLKSYIISNNKNIRQKHDLEYLNNAALKINKSFIEIKNECNLLNSFVPKIKYSNKYKIIKQEMDKIIKSLEIISKFPPIKEMRALFAEKHKYEIVVELTTSQENTVRR
jgi:HEPN domain-containing protein